MTKVSKIKRTIEEKIKKNFPDAKFKIEDTSFKHRSHIQNKFRKESHRLQSAIEALRFLKRTAKRKREKMMLENILQREVR